jgi:hypothetical protein
MILYMGSYKYVWWICKKQFELVVFKPLIREEVKGKAIPLQAWTGPEGSRRMRLPHFKTIGT